MARKYERKYAPKMNKALREQINAYIRTGDISSIKSDEVLRILDQMALDVGVNWAYRATANIRVKKERKPLGYTERITQLIRNFYTVDMLNMSKNITETTKDQIRQVLSEAAQQGYSIQQITNMLESPMLTASRAQLIARTEVIGAANNAAVLNAQDLGATKKVWIATKDSRTRDDHRKLDGQTVAFTESFKIEDKDGITRTMMQPGDKNGGPGQVCNCRCVVAFE